MFSYIFMKILESRPQRYDWGINFLTGGHANRVKREIIQNNVKPDIKMLDVGCGTGLLAVEAATVGAAVVGIDISEGMLSVAQKRIIDKKLNSKVTLHHAGVVEIDTLFNDNSFDLITSTLVISELYPEERRWALSEFRRILKPSGMLVLAGEVKPDSLIKKLLYFLIRFPLAVITYIISQTGTKAVSNISEEIYQAGFEIINEKRSLLGSFAAISAKKSIRSKKLKFSEAKKPDDDFSVLKSIWDYIGRWFPNPVEPGLREIGKPDKNSPVIVTSNFHLTVRRVEKALRNENCYLLVAPSNGINVWCASCGGDFNTHSVITVIKTGRIEKKVRHRNMILPQFCAPGIDTKMLKKQTGWKTHWGPAYAKGLPSYISSGRKKSPDQSLAKYPFCFRVEMLISMNFLIWVLVGLITLIINPYWFLYASAIFWGAGIILFAGYRFLPGKSGWVKALLLSMLEILCIALFSHFILDLSWWTHWGWMITAFIITMMLGFDLRGTIGGNPSEAELLVHKLGVKSIGHLFSSEGINTGIVEQDMIKCTKCRTCLNVCPKGVFGITKKGKDVIMVNKNECLRCNACIMQCPAGALSVS